MADITSLLATTPSGVDSPKAGASGFSSMTSEQFVKIMLTEMSKQDPLKPNDSSAILQQLANIRSIQSDLDMSARLSSLVGQNELSAASGLIGREVSGVDDTNARATGVVSSVARTNTGAVLTLTNGRRIAMNKLDGINAGTGATP